MSNKLFRRSLIGKQQQQQRLGSQTGMELVNCDDVILDPCETTTTAPEDEQEARLNNDIPYTRLTTPYKHMLAKSTFNLCDDEKLSLSLMANGEHTDEPSILPEKKPKMKLHESTAGNYCTLPRRPKSALCSFHTIVYEKGPGKKKLGFTVVGGTDTGAIGIFIKSILPTGQAGQDGRLKTGDEILAVNGQVCHDLSHEEAVKLFKSVKCGEIALQVCRRVKAAKLDAMPA